MTKPPKPFVALGYTASGPLFTEQQLRDYGRAEYLRGLETVEKYLLAHGIDNARFFALGVRALAGKKTCPY